MSDTQLSHAREPRPMQIEVATRATGAHRGELECCADSVLACLPNGCAIEFLRDLRTHADATTQVNHWIRTVNLRPVPEATANELKELFAKLDAKDFRLSHLTRKERQLDDLLRAVASDPQLDDVARICERVRSRALAGYETGDYLAAVYWVELGARLAQHPFALDQEVGERTWQILEDAHAGQTLDLQQFQFPAHVVSNIEGARAAQDRALVARHEALVGLRALAIQSASRPWPPHDVRDLHDDGCAS